ncbi:hypothetical protein GCM10027063_15950 [Promicromonospora xylanilytica]
MNDERRARLARLLRERAAGDEPRRWRLSIGQEAMYLLESVSPTADLRMGEALTIEGTVNLDALDRAAVRLHERHPILASVVVPDDEGDLVQEVRPAVSPLIVRAGAAAVPDAELDARLADEIDRPFDLGDDRPLRLTVYPAGPDKCVLLFVLHHLAGDFWTLVVLVRDLIELYRAECEGRAPDLPPVVADFADFARLERLEAAGDRGAEHAAYWRQILRDPPGPLQLPPDPAAAHDPAPSSLYRIPVPAETADALRTVAGRLGATRYHVLLAAYAVFLARHTGNPDVVIGVPMTQRGEQRWRDVAGYLINTVPVRLRVDEDVPFADLVTRARDAFLGAFEHGTLPYPRLVELLRDEAGSTDTGPVFDTLLVLRGNPVEELSAVAGMSLGDGGGVIALDDHATARSRGLPRRDVGHPLALSLGDVDGRLEAGWDFQPHRFREGTVARLAERFVAVLTRATADAEVPVAALTALAAPDEADLAAWNPEPLERPDDRTVHAGFLDHAARTPAAEALVCGGVRFTYGELEALARRQAAALREHGVRPGDRVAVHVPRGWEQVVGVLGVVLCGAAYVPVDPDLPSARRTTVLEQADVRHVLVRDGAPDLWPPPCVTGWSQVVRPVPGDAAVPGDGATGDGTDLPRVPSDALAYIIFTSGSTGVPKGVMIEHGAACTTLDDLARRLGLGPWSRVLALSSLSFDLSVFDVFGVLGAGGTVVVPEEGDVRDPERWCQLVRAERVTVWNTVPALAQLAAEQAAGTDALATVRWYLLSGDWIPLSLPDMARACSPGARVLGMGGATEASIWSIAYEVGEVGPAWASIPYGRPLTNQSFHVLDDRGRDVPPGVVGELCIGGHGVARGYVGDPERTAQSFVESAAHGRLYRTGDLGRHLPDGVIEFLGRSDRQVKVNGFRVEIGEVEAALREQPGVDDVHVVATDALGGRRLVAFVVGPAADPGRVRDGAAARLPGYMLPATIHVLAAWPLTANGKVDHAALLTAAGEGGGPRTEPVRTDAAGTAPPAAPHAEARAGHEVVQAVRDVLGIDAAPGDSFLGLGGDSVAAIRVAMALRKQGLTVGASRLLLADTLAAVAPRPVTTDVAAPGGTDAPGEDLPLTPMQTTMYLHAMTSRIPGLYCEHVLLDLHGGVDVPRLERAWQHVVDREPGLRMRVHQADDGRLVQRAGPVQVRVQEVHAGTASTSEGADSVGAVVDRLVDEDRARGFDLAAGPLTWWRLVRRADEDRAVLVWTHHHLLLDGWSLPLVLRAVLRAYAEDVMPGAATAARGSALGSLLRQRDRSAKERHESVTAYWEDALADGVPDAPVPRAATGAFRHAETEVTLDEDEYGALLGLAADARVTASTLVQGAWAAVLAARTGERRAMFGLTLSGRDSDSDGLDDAVAMLVNTVPVGVDVDPYVPVHDWLRRLQETAFAASDHADVQLAELERSVAHDGRSGDLFDSLVVFENLPLDELGTGGGGIVPGSLRFTEVIGMPLALYAFPGRTLTLRLAYDGSGWDRQWAAELLGELRRTLRALAGARPGSSLGQVLRSGPRPAGVPEGLVGPDAASPPDDVVRRVFAAAEEHPDRVALEGTDGMLTYAELVDAALVVAARLRDVGVGPECVVSVVAPRSVRGVVLQLGVLAAGAAYAPSTPRRPRVVEEHVLVPDTATLARLDLPHGTVGIVATASADEPGAPRPLDGPVPRAAGSAAYVVHTSGSTGAPRGVVVPDDAFGAFVGAAVRRYGLRPEDRLLHFATPEFDTAVEEVWCGLAAGASVVVRDESWTDSVDAFLDRVVATGCTVLDLPTAFWAEVVGHLAGTGRGLPAAVRLVVVGGEAVPAGALDRWRDVGGGARLMNSYGPTETTVVVTAGELA